MNNQTSQRSWSLTSIMRDMGQAWRLFRDPNIPSLMKLLLPVAAVVYFISPFDLMPGLPFDDIAILVVALRLFVQFAERMQPQARNAQQSAHTNGSQATGQTIETSWTVVEE